MKWTAIDTLEAGEYLSGDYRIEHAVAGFGISRATLFYQDRELRPFVGHDALRQAQAFAAKHATEAA